MMRSTVYKGVGWCLIATILADHARGTEDMYSPAAWVVGAVLICTGVLLKELGR